MFTRPILLALLVAPILAGGCLSPDEDETTETAEVVGSPRGSYFKIQSLGNRCVDAGAVNTDGVGPLVIRTCSPAQSQIFQFGELDATRDVMLKPLTSSRCVGVNGPVIKGRRVTLEPCDSSSPSQRFAWDGDALLMGTQAAGEPVSRDLAFESFDGVTNVDTWIEVNDRDLSDAEYWRLIPVGTNPRPHPHGGFITVGDEIQLREALAAASWGTVIEVAPTTTDDIVLETFPMKQALKAGVTLRGDRRFVFNGQRLVVPQSRTIGDEEYLLRLEDHSRVTGLRIEGNHATSGLIWGLMIGDPRTAPETPEAIIDHVELSHWSESIVVWGSHESDPDSRFACPNPEQNRTKLPATIARNFFHHNRDYGVVVGAGGGALVQGNLMFNHGAHNITASYVGFNRYDAHDNLFTSQEDKPKPHAIFDVHGSCAAQKNVAEHQWEGGIAGDRFDVGWSSFLTDRVETLQIRGTPCDHVGFHDNLSTEAEAGNVAIKKEAPRFFAPNNNDCRSAVDPYAPGADSAILVTDNNRFEIANPLRACPRRAAGAAGDCNSGDLAVGDFDGDGRDDLFFGSGATWWYSSAGKAEWRFLNRKPNTASDLRFGDLDADGRTDVIALQRNRLVVSWAGASKWLPLSIISAPGFENIAIDDLAVGQFDTDRRADLFVSNGVTWLWASGGLGPWNIFGGNGFRTNQLRFGDFTQDGITDVFAIISNRWRILPGPGATWQPLGVAQVTSINELVVADFDGIGGADIAFFRDNPWPSVDEWRVSRGGTAASTRLTYADRRLAPLPVGNFDLATGADVLYWNNDLWLSLASDRVTGEKWSRQSMR